MSCYHKYCSKAKILLNNGNRNNTQELTKKKKTAQGSYQFVWCAWWII